MDEIGHALLQLADVEQYMSSLNVMNHGRGFRGYADWRVPTTEELASLLEYNRLNKSPYEGALFDAKKGAYFSADHHQGSQYALDRFL